MKNLGKIILLLCLSASAFAGLNVSVDKQSVSRGESVSLSIKITGKGKVKIPPFDQICGYDIEEKRQERKDLYANGRRVQELSLIYSFMPQKSCIIDAFSVSINGVEEMSKPINVKVSKLNISKNDPFRVHLEASKDFVYVGEPFEMSVDFSQRQNIRTLGEGISLPESKNIWIKGEEKGRHFVKDGYSKRINIYALSAQQSGKLLLGPLRWDLQVKSQKKDYWGYAVSRAKTRTVFSNELEINVKPLPEGIILVGNLEIQAHVDKNQINAGEAVNLTISVKGRGNIEDIENFSIHLQGAQAFNEDPTTQDYIQAGKYFGSFTQKSALVAQKDFVIPAFTLKYMDTKTDTIKTISTKEIEVKVNNEEVLTDVPLKISKAKIEDINKPIPILNYIQAGFLLLAGFVLGVLVSLIPWKRLFQSEGSKSKIVAKESKEVLQLLMSNMDKDPQIEGLVKNLSENLYEGKGHKIDKKVLKEIVKKLS